MWNRDHRRGSEKQGTGPSVEEKNHSGRCDTYSGVIHSREAKVHHVQKHFLLYHYTRGPAPESWCVLGISLIICPPIKRIFLSLGDESPPQLTQLGSSIPNDATLWDVTTVSLLDRQIMILDRDEEVRLSLYNRSGGSGGHLVCHFRFIIQDVVCFLGSYRIWLWDHSSTALTLSAS